LLGFVVKHHDLVLLSLTEAQKPQCLTLSNKLLRKLRSFNYQSWQVIITIDDLWFYFTTDYEQISLRPDQKPPEKPKHTIQENTIIVTIAWNPLGFHVLEALPTARIFDAEHYRDNILTALVSPRPETGRRKHAIHADNARAHTAQKCIPFCAENGLGRATHPPYSRPHTSLCSYMLGTACSGCPCTTRKNT
jgi:hypothetical protein